MAWGSLIAVLLAWAAARLRGWAAWLLRRAAQAEGAASALRRAGSPGNPVVSKPPPHWLAHLGTAEPPAHWLERVNRGSPQWLAADAGPAPVAGSTSPDAGRPAGRLAAQSRPVRADAQTLIRPQPFLPVTASDPPARKPVQTVLSQVEELVFGAGARSPDPANSARVAAPGAKGQMPPRPSSRRRVWPALFETMQALGPEAESALEPVSQPGSRPELATNFGTPARLPQDATPAAGLADTETEITPVSLPEPALPDRQTHMRAQRWPEALRTGISTQPGDAHQSAGNGLPFGESGATDRDAELAPGRTQPGERWPGLPATLPHDAQPKEAETLDMIRRAEQARVRRERLDREQRGVQWSG